MRRLPLLLVAAAAAASFAAPANASLYCRDLGPVPGYGPVCTVECALGTSPQVNPKDVPGTLRSFVVVCPA
jgi:hypothetical protein